MGTKTKRKKENEEDRKVNYTKVVVTEVTQEAKIYAQHVDEGPKLEALMKRIREEFASNPPLAGAYQPKKGDLCAAKFVDDYLLALCNLCSDEEYASQGLKANARRFVVQRIET